MFAWQLGGRSVQTLKRTGKREIFHMKPDIIIKFFVQGSCGGPCGALPPNPSKSCIFEVQSNPSVEAMDIKPIPNDFAENLNDEYDEKADIQAQLTEVETKVD